MKPYYLEAARIINSEKERTSPDPSMGELAIAVLLGARDVGARDIRRVAQEIDVPVEEVALLWRRFVEAGIIHAGRLVPKPRRKDTTMSILLDAMVGCGQLSRRWDDADAVYKYALTGAGKYEALKTISRLGLTVRGRQERTEEP